MYVYTCTRIWTHRRRTPAEWIGPRDVDATSPGIRDARQMVCERCGGRDFKKPSLLTPWQCTVCGSSPGKDCTIAVARSPSPKFKFPFPRTLGEKTSWEPFGEDLLIQRRFFDATRPGHLCLAKTPSAKMYFLRQTFRCWRWSSWENIVLRVEVRERDVDWRTRPDTVRIPPALTVIKSAPGC